MKRKRKALGKTVNIVVLGLMVGLITVFIGTIFIFGITESIRNMFGVTPRGTMDDSIYSAECLRLCDTEFDIYKCAASPDGSNELCGEILTRIKEAEDDLPGEPTSSIGTIKLDGDFLPCSEMSVIFKNINPEDIIDLSINIESVGGTTVPVRDATGTEITDVVDEYYLLCSSAGTPCTQEVKFKLPCEYKPEVQAFKPEIKHTISFTSGNAIGTVDDTLKLPQYKNKKWSCLNYAKFPDGISFNQIVTTDTTKVEFIKEIRPELQPMIAMTKINLVSGQCEEPSSPIDTPIVINPCEFGIGHPFGLTYVDPNYHFTMPRIKGELEDIRFTIHLAVNNLDGTPAGDIEICTTQTTASITCKSTVAYLCYEDTDDSKEYILSGPSDSGAHTIDGVCKYTDKTEYKNGCIKVSDGSPTSDAEAACSLPDKMYREDTMIQDATTDECKVTDLEIVNIHPYKSSSDCDENTYFTAADTEGWIAVDIRNNGNKDIKIHEGNLHLTINGNAEAVHIITADNTITIPTGKTSQINDTTINTIKPVAHLVEGTYTIEAKIDNLDTLKYPVVDESSRNANNMLTKQITVYPQCCGDCVSCATTAACVKCPKICEWTMDPVGGGSECIKII